MTALVTKHLPLVAGAPDGIKKLRAFILELAVRGMLVPQDPSDEPSQEVLTRAEQALAGREIKRKSKERLEDAESIAPPYEVPKGWAWTRLGNVSDVIRGVTYSKSDAHDQPGPNLVPLLRGNNISDGALNFEGPVFVPSSLVSADQYIRAGDLVIAMSSGSADLVGKAAQAENDFHGAFGAFCGVVRPAISDFFPYFGFFFQTPFYRSNAAGRGKGIGINNLQKTALQSLYVPVPPLAEQHRIVAKVDELMALCDRLEADQADAEAAHAQLVQALLDSLTQATDAADFRASWQRLSEHFHTLFTTEASIDALKQTVLQLAVMGKLVKQDLAVPEDGRAALEKIIAWRKKALIGKEIREPRSPVKVIGIEEHPYELPGGWAWVRLGTLIYIQSGDGLTAANMRAGTIPVFGGNGINGYHDECNVVSPTLVIGRVGYYCGSIHVTPENAWVTDNAFITKFCADAVDIRFLYWLLKITNLKENDSATAQPVISGSKIYPIVVGLPPLDEQRRIVTKVDELMSLCDQLKAHVSEARQHHEQLAQALVEQAIS